jgi:hypothetical protein
MVALTEIPIEMPVHENEDFEVEIDNFDIKEELPYDHMYLMLPSVVLSF